MRAQQVHTPNANEGTRACNRRTRLLYPMTTPQVDFRLSNLQRSPRSAQTARHGKPRDRETQFREAAFSMWNTIGEKQPSCWRAGIPMTKGERLLQLVKMLMVMQMA